MSKPLNSYTAPIGELQAHRLRELLEERGFAFEPKPYSLFSAKKGKLNVTVYEKGPKVLVQGKETEEFVTFTLEPEILGEAKLGYEEELNPEMFEPHLGVDESGKGDFFGPLTVAGVFVDRAAARALLDAGITDSKKIGSDAKIRELAKIVRETPGTVCEVIRIGPRRYNEMYESIGNLNRLLAWGHAKIIENVLERRPDCPRALSDQFANPRVLERALRDRGKSIELQQRTKAESDVAVAAASILAREGFIDWMRDASEAVGLSLPKGASAQVKQAGRRIVERFGREKLRELSKLHFKTAGEIISGN
ncbi:MAG: ribonuclease HIII [Verrucomicrobiae bacterium]|nr:ribonuclease HIII [Verrucomicrobiae bacterium]MCP5538992.1 ribonuclease HIII [Akkermansiaceae bacterium]MCP5550621.1 ribonuclease HIII [Akkermansiaceae bacterium]